MFRVFYYNPLVFFIFLLSLCHMFEMFTFEAIFLKYIFFFFCVKCLNVNFGATINVDKITSFPISPVAMQVS